MFFKGLIGPEPATANPFTRLELLDQLSSGQLSAIIQLLRVMTDPIAHSLASAPIEEEALSPETAAAIERARASLAHGKGIPHEEILREFGIDK
ncbi:MAG TPA: hypothetical protein VMU05_06465 [Dongiaceae bacterium]|nr:hypothetical protein [Dongiaceae bacterium]